MGYSEHFSSRSNFEQISNRLRKSRIVDSEVTDFLRERITIEEKYVADLLRLSKKGLSVEKDQLGGINDSWDKILALTTFCVEINDTIDRSNRARIEKELSFQSRNCLIVLFEVLKAFARSELTIHTKMADVASSVAEVLNNFDIAENVETFCRKKGTNTDGGFTGTYDSAESPSSRKDFPPIVDSEGFSLPPISTPKWPPPAEQAQPKFKIEIKDKAVSENPEISMQAMQNVVASMLPLQPKSLGSGAPNQSSAISALEIMSCRLPNSSSVGKCRAVLQGSESIERVVINDQFASQPDFNQQTLIELDFTDIRAWGRSCSDSEAQAPLQGLSFLLNLQNASNISSVQTIPTALLWRVDDIRTDDIASSETHKLLARFETQDDLASAQVAVGFDLLDTDGVLLRNIEKTTITGK
ncbi:hypothetical protein BC829DRAFT_405699 [Chytridium lagenaria]|nr:hypothetical protein BC829DRAFT_405699 [Chytridium lagenaria]